MSAPREWAWFTDAADDVAAIGGGRLDEVSRIAGPGMALLANDRGVCGLVRWDDERGVAYDEGGAHHAPAPDIGLNVLAYIAARGSAVFGDLLRAFPWENRWRVKRALASLVERGKIARAGTRRGALYAMTREAADEARVNRFELVRRAAKRSSQAKTKASQAAGAGGCNS